MAEKRLKIAFYSPYLTDHLGGGEKHLLDVATVCAKTGAEVHICVPQAMSDASLDQLRRQLESTFGVAVADFTWIRSPLFDAAFSWKKLNWTKQFDVLYFVDWLNKAVCRLGYNGNDTLETINGMKSFFANNLKWVWNEDRPANGLGICSVFDQRYREAMWTFRGFNPDIPQWSEDSLYEEGAVVSYGTHSWYSDIPNFYTATVESEGVLPTDTDYWTQVPYTDANYYNLYTIAFSELKNEFQLFLTPKPLIYAQFEDGYLVPRPISNTGQIYLSDSGERLAWFNDGSTVMTDNAYFDAVINYPQGRKKFTALSIESDIAPTSIICTTPTFSSVTPNPDAVQREGNEWVVPIRKATVTLGSSILWGDWAKFRFVMSNAAYNKINSFACKLRASIARQTDS